MDLSFPMAPAGWGSVRSWGGFARCQWVRCGGTVGIMEVWPGPSLFGALWGCLMGYAPCEELKLAIQQVLTLP